VPDVVTNIGFHIVKIAALFSVPVANFVPLAGWFQVPTSGSHIMIIGMEQACLGHVGT